MKHHWRDPHIAHAIQSLLKALYITAGVFVTCFVIFHIGISLYVSSVSKTQIDTFNAGIKKDMDYLKTEGDAVSRSSPLINALENKNRDELLDIIQDEKNKRNVGSMSVTDEKGIVLGRTLSVGKYGDNVFLTTAIGRAVSEGKPVQSIEITSLQNQIYMSTARPIEHGGSIIGALFSSRLLDDMYARQFKDAYLSKGSHVVFYIKNLGVYGDSFEDPARRSIINSYFNSGSEWVGNGMTDKTVVFDDGVSYFVKNIIFEGLEKSSGGALIFVPYKNLSKTADLITAFLTCLAFLIIAYYYHRRFRGDERSWRYYVLLFGVSCVVFISIFVFSHIQNSGRLHLRHIAYPLYNSTLRFEPESGIYAVPSEQRVSIVVDTGDEAINVVQLKLLFDPQSVTVSSIESGTSTCSYIVENYIDEVNGTVTFTCGILDRDGDRRSVPVASLLLIPKHSGAVKLAFDKGETRVLANDGLGTDVLRDSQDGSYRFDAFDTILDEDHASSTKSTGRTFVVYSPTHPNESRWYSASQASFVWRGKPDALYRYTFDASPTTVPGDKNITRGNKIEIPIPGDGTYYFHLQLASGGPIAHYRVQSDMTPPIITAMNLSTSDPVIAGDVIRFSFDAFDMVSGIQKNYYVDLGDHLFLPIGQELFVPFLEAGDQTMTLRVYDSAGNYAEKSRIIHVIKK